MSTDFIQTQISQGFLAIAFLGLPLLLISCLIGFAFAVFQAATQIQDQTLPQVVKILVIGLLLFLVGGALSGPLVSFTISILTPGSQ